MSQSLSSQGALAGILARHLATTLDLSALLEDVACTLPHHFPLDAAYFLVPHDGGWRAIAARVGRGPARSRGPRAAVGGQFALPDIAHAPRAEQLELPPPRQDASGGRWLLPLAYKGKVLALLDLYPTQPLTDEQEGALDALCEPLVTVLHNAYTGAIAPASTAFAPLETPTDAAEPREPFERLYEGLTRIARATDVHDVLQLICDFIAASGWRTATASLRERHQFRITHMASTGLTEKEHNRILRSAKGGFVWHERLGPTFESFRHDDWYYLPHEGPDSPGAESGPEGSGDGQGGRAAWHPLDLLYLPMRARDGTPIGLVVLDEPEDQQAPTRKKMQPIQLFVRNAALMLENQRLRWENERRLAATRIVQETASLVSGATHVQGIVRHLVEQLVAQFDYPLVVVFLREGNRFEVRGEHGYPDGVAFDYVNEGRGVVGRAAYTQETQWVPTVSEDVDYIEGHPAVTSEIAVPLLREEEVLGIINVESTVDRPLTIEDKELLETLAEQLTNAIVNARLFNEIQRHALQLETASEVSRRVTLILNIDQLLDEVVDLIGHKFGYYLVHIFMHDEASNQWVMRAGWGASAAQLKDEGHAFANDRGIVGRVGATGMSILAPNVDEHPYFRPNPQLPDTRAELAVPLRLGSDILGVLDVQSDRRAGLSESDQSLLETLGNQVAVALHNASLFGQVEAQLGERDALYRASYAISGAQAVADVLAAIVEPLSIPHIIRAGLLVAQNLSPDGWPECLEVAAVWNPTDEPLRIEPGTMLRVEAYPALHQLATDQVQVVHNVAEDERLDAATRAVVQGLGVHAMALVPLRVGSKVIGWLLLLSDRADSLTPGLLQPYQTLADQAALAVERIRLLEQTQTRARRLQALNDLSASIIASLDLQQTLDDSVRAMADLFGVRQSGVLLFDDALTQGRLVAQYREDGYQHPDEIIVPLVDNPLTERLFATRAPVFVRDVETDPLAKTIREGTHPRSYNALLVVPLLTRDRVIGSISLDVVGEEERDFDPEEINLAQTMAAQIATAIENARLYEEATRRARDMETASLIGQNLTRLLDEASLIREVVQLIADRFGFPYVGLFLRHETHANRLELREGSGALGQSLRSRGHALWEGQGLPGRVLQRGELVVANDVRHDPRYQRHPLLRETAAEAAIPLKLGGTLLGVLDVHSNESGSFDDETVAVLATIAGQLAVALQNARLFETQRDTVKQLQEVDRLKSEFLASMSHELRTPLNSIIGFSKIILRGIDGPLTELQRQDITSIYNSGHHLLALINDILDLSKIVAGRLELSLSTVDVAAVVDEVMLALEPQTIERGLHMEVTLAPDLPPVRADRRRVRQILLNLLSNAVKFTEEGGVFVSAHRVARPVPGEGRTQGVGDPDGRWLEIAVKDTGIGIRPEEQEIIFEEFRQLSGPASRRAGGTGLGLAIARRFAELHGSSLWLESRYGFGSTFRFALPIAAESADTVPEAEAPAAQGAG